MEKDNAIKLVEVARSFSYKLNTGNYSSADFFSSQKEQCTPEEVSEVSRRLFEKCKEDVIEDIKLYKEKYGETRTNGDTGEEETKYAIPF